MGRVTGLGGVFVKTDDPDGLREWYRTRLGIDVEDFGASFTWREAMNPDVTGYSVWGVFPQATHYFDPSSRPFMINFRVDDLDRVLKTLRSAGESVADGVHEDEYGRFGWVMDPDGTRIELWDAAGATLLAVREVGGGEGMGNHGPLLAHFGLAAAWGGGLGPYTVRVRFANGAAPVVVSERNTTDASRRAPGLPPAPRGGGPGSARRTASRWRGAGRSRTPTRPGRLHPGCRAHGSAR